MKCPNCGSERTFENPNGNGVFCDPCHYPMTTLNDRLLALMQKELGSDPTAAMFLGMFSGNIQSIPENELRSSLQKYLKVLQDLLTPRTP